MCLLFSKLSKYYHHPSSQWTVFEPFITVKRPGMFQLQAHSQFHTEISFLYLFFPPLRLQHSVQHLIVPTGLRVKIWKCCAR